MAGGARNVAHPGFARIGVHDPKHIQASVASGTAQRRGPQGTARPQNGSVTTHYSAAELDQLVPQVNRILATDTPGAGPDNPEATDRLPP